MHEALESYDLPDGILVNGNESFSPIFRDVTELTAAHSLSEKIKQALKQSSFLIVLCSPTAKESHWVNEEIRLFRELHGDRKILSAIVEGSPSTAFPPALLENGHEPLAANLKQGRDSFRFGVHQLAASILGVGLDTLVQRGEHKRRLRTQLAAGIATGLAVIMGGLWFNAQSAQKQAEQSRDDAERLVEYMVSDLKGELYSLQRLDILDGLGEEIVEYYEGIEPERLSDERLVKLITALQTLAEVSNLEQNWESSHRILDDASELIEVLEKRDPESNDSLFFRAQNEFWEGQVHFYQRNYDKVLPHWIEYNSIGKKLHERNPENKKWILEAGWGSGNLGTIYRLLNENETARGHYLESVQIFETIYIQNKKDIFISYEYANKITGLSKAEKELGNSDRAMKLSQQVLRIYDYAIKHSATKNYVAEHYHNQALRQILIYKGLSPCRSEEFNKVHHKSLELHLYEPGNELWREEYYSQQLDKIQDCLENFPNQNMEQELSQFLRDMKFDENKKFAQMYSMRIKKLRAISPESLQ